MNRREDFATHTEADAGRFEAIYGPDLGPTRSRYASDDEPGVDDLAEERDGGWGA